MWNELKNKIKWLFPQNFVYSIILLISGYALKDVLIEINNSFQNNETSSILEYLVLSLLLISVTILVIYNSLFKSKK